MTEAPAFRPVTARIGFQKVNLGGASGRLRRFA